MRNRTDWVLARDVRAPARAGPYLRARLSSHLAMEQRVYNQSRKNALLASGLTRGQQPVVRKATCSNKEGEQDGDSKNVIPGQHGRRPATPFLG